MPESFERLTASIEALTCLLKGDECLLDGDLVHCLMEDRLGRLDEVLLLKLPSSYSSGPLGGSDALVALVRPVLLNTEFLLVALFAVSNTRFKDAVALRPVWLLPKVEARGGGPLITDSAPSRIVGVEHLSSSCLKHD